MFGQDIIPFQSGTRIDGRYEVLEPLGTGAMGFALRVIDHALNDDRVVLKILHGRHSGDQTKLARFRNEVLIMRKLSHPNIVSVYDFGCTEQGHYYISMEYVDGESLRQRMDAPDFAGTDFTSRLEIVQQICRGLALAHRYEVIHRDLKPENILLAKSGTAKLSDFGLACILSEQHRLTRTGDTLGTPLYMAPEQFEGLPADARSDIYSLGILSFELIAGRPPFEAETYYGLARLHLQHPLPELTVFGAAVPGWFQDLLDRTTAKDRLMRWQTVELIEDFIRANAQSGVELRTLGCPLEPLPAISIEDQQQRLKRRSAMTGVIILFVSIGILAAIRLHPWLRITSSVRLVKLEQMLSDVAMAPGARYFTIFVKFLSGVSLSANEESYSKALEQGRLEDVLILIMAGMNPNLALKDGRTALMSAAEAGDTILIRELIEQGAWIEAKTLDGKTALDFAKQGGSISATALLEAARAEINRQGELS